MGLLWRAIAQKDMKKMVAYSSLVIMLAAAAATLPQAFASQMIQPRTNFSAAVSAEVVSFIKNG